MLPLFLLCKEIRQAERTVWMEPETNRLSCRREIIKNGTIFRRVPAKVKRQLLGRWGSFRLCGCASTKRGVSRPQLESESGIGAE
jgi:hypothetical protein